MLKFKRIPKHTGIIPDGNRRWAAARGLPKERGYEYGIEPGKMLLEEVLKFDGIKEVSTYIFTQENTRRPKRQIIAALDVIVKFFNWLKNKDVSIRVIGDTNSPYFPKELISFTIPEQRDKDLRLKLNFLVNYSWKWDLGMILANSRLYPLSGKRDILNRLGSKSVSRLDLIIRWGGRSRLSGFLPVQSAYADIFVVDALWPDFSVDQFHNALKWYEKQDITLGG